MNWKLILLLSLLGLAMGIATVFFIPSNIEPAIWLPLFLLAAYLFATQTRRPFVHGLMLGIANSVWVTASHIVFFDRYIANHAREAAMMTSMPFAPRVMMALTGPVIGIMSGIVIGALSWVVSKIVGGGSRAAAA